MFGEQIFARSLTFNSLTDRNGRIWQYHSRSDHHSKVACWCVLFDLLVGCEKLRSDVASEKIGFGINHEMRDFRSGRKKNLDLVICRPVVGYDQATFRSLVDRYNIRLTSKEENHLASLPNFRSCDVGTTLLALEAKACMTEHGKARPRLYDELASSFQAINGDTNSSIAAGFVTINTASTFISPDRNRKISSELPLEISEHKQPRAAIGVYEKVRELPRRSDPSGYGFDALGVTFVDCRNDGSKLEIREHNEVLASIEPQYAYAGFISRISTIYSTRFAAM